MQLDDITLPEDLIWKDEFDWSPVVQSVAYSLTGAAIIEHAVKQAGRPITLVGDTDSGWATRSIISALITKAASPTAQMVLTLNDSRTFLVIFRHSETPVEARPVTEYNVPDDEDFYTLTLRFLVIG